MVRGGGEERRGEKGWEGEEGKRKGRRERDVKRGEERTIKKVVDR